MDAIHDIAPGPSSAGVLLVMLPGAMHKPQDLIANGFPAALRERALPISVVMPDAHAGYYLDGDLVDRLSADIIVPAGARGYSDIWLMGISLGGLGALMYARAHARAVKGVIVLAPYLGVPGTIHEVARAGGLRTWQPSEEGVNDDERGVLQWLKGYGLHDSVPAIYLGYGKQDRFAAASELLRECLPPHHVTAIAGGHDWATWRALWKLLLDQGLFARRLDAQQNGRAGDQV
jgi:pimeloyl-ACP methyl ester carboxylesterase